MKRSIIFLITAFGAATNLLAGTFSVTSGNGVVEKGTDCIIFENASQGSITFTTGNLPLRDLKCFQNSLVDGKIQRDSVPTANLTLAADSQSVTIKNITANRGYEISYNNYSYGEPLNESAYACVIDFLPLSKVYFPDTVVCDEVELFIEPEMVYFNQYGNTKKITRELSIGYHAFGLRGENPSIDSISYVTNASDHLYLDTLPYTDTKFYISDLTGKQLFKKDLIIATEDTFFNHAVIAFPRMTTSAKQEHEGDDSKDSTMNFYPDIDMAKEAAKDFRHSAPLFINLDSRANDITNHYEWAFIQGDDAINNDFNGAYTYFDKYVNAFEISDPGLHCIELTISNIRDDSACAHKSYGCLQITESDIYVPNVFTPNGDGTNDEFRVAYRSISEFEISIYDQWGRRVYQSDDITKGWDGTFHGDLASMGTYFYVIKAKGTDDYEYVIKGSVNLLRTKK